MGDCDRTIRETGAGCCERCFTADTHGLLVAADRSEDHRDIANLTRLAAQAVIARGEHANAIRQLRAQVDALTETVAVMQAQAERVDEGEKRRLLAEVMREVRAAVKSLPERVAELEEVAVGLERHLKIRRKPKAERQLALPPGPPAAVPLGIEDEEPKRRRLRRRKDEPESEW